MQRRYRLECATPLALFGVAASCFWISRNLSLEWTDEGHIIYPIWRVSEGALPYLDFRQLYPPSVFFLNGALMRLFGADLAVIRISLVLVKAALATAVYLNARLVASRAFALLVYAFAVVVWTTPWWVFNTPYANHYGLLLDLVGIFGFLKLQRRFAPACVWAGLCFGAAATFKQTSGIFAVVAWALFLLWDDEPGRIAVRREVSRWVDGIARAVRWVTLLAAAGICSAYLAPRNSWWTLLLLLPPIAWCILVLVRRELAGVDQQRRLHSVIGLLWAGVGMAIPLAGYAVYYARRGRLVELLADTVTELPKRTNWFDPLPFPTPRSAALTLGVLAFLAAARLAASSPGGRSRRSAALSWLSLGIVCVAAALVHAAGSVGLSEYVARALWHQDLLGTLYVLPFAVVWVSLWQNVVSAGESGRQRPDPPDAASRRALALLSFFAAVSLLFLYPAGDFWHLVMSLPAFLPLFAHLLQRYATPPPAGEPAVSSARVRLLPTAAVFGLIIVLCIPFVDSLRFVLWMRPGVRGAFERAPGIIGWPPKFGEAADLVAYLDSQPADARLFVLCDEQMLYFLARRPSVLERDEFVLYLVGAGLIQPQDAHALVAESRMIGRLEETKPLVIDYAGSPMSGRFRKEFAEVGRFIGAHFRVVARFGGYQVFAWTDG